MTIRAMTIMPFILAFVLHSQLFSGVIAMLVFPEQKQVVCKEEDKKCYEFFRVQMQFFKPNQVCLVSSKDRPDHNFGTIANTRESPEVWQQLLENGSRTAYSLSWHKQFRNISEDDELKIFTHLGDNQFQNSSVPVVVLKNILKFMMLDQQSTQFSCYEFVRETAFNFVENRGSEYEVYNLFDQLEYQNNESQFLPGDAILCYYSDGNIMNPKHFALALGDGKYLAKNGYGGFLGISKLCTMLAFWGCNQCGKIKQEALENKYLWKILETRLAKG